MGLRSYKSTRLMSSILVDGEPEKEKESRLKCPMPSYTNCDRIVARLEDLIKQTPQKAIQARLCIEGYAGVPLAKKLGIRPGYTVSPVGAAEGRRETVVDLWDNVAVRDGIIGNQ